MPVLLLTPGRGNYWVWPNGDYIIWGNEPMTYTLFDLSYRVARECGIVLESIATGGSTSTLIDTLMLDQQNDYWNKGTIWILRDAGGASAAPEREVRIISDFVNSSATANVSSNFTAAVASGDRFAIAEKYIPYDVIVQKINQALTDLGPIPYTDTSSLTTAADTTEYTLPGATNLDLREVYLQINLGEPDNNAWQPIHNWRKELSDPGNADTLILPETVTAGYALKLVYIATHPQLFQPTDPLSEHVPLERVIYPAVLECLRWRKVRNASDQWNDEIAKYEQKMLNIKAMHPITYPQRSNRIGIFKTDAAYYPGDRNER